MLPRARAALEALRSVPGPSPGHIVGEGIRLGVFRLDESNRQVAEWLVEDVFYHPER